MIIFETNFNLLVGNFSEQMMTSDVYWELTMC